MRHNPASNELNYYLLISNKLIILYLQIPATIIMYTSRLKLISTTLPLPCLEFNNIMICNFIRTCWLFQFFAFDEFFWFEFFEAVDVAICCWVWCIICWIISNCCLVKLSSLSAAFLVSDWPLCLQNNINKYDQ